MELSRCASRLVREARLILAGNATLRDFSLLPRLAEDAIAQEIWEGTHLVLAGHVLKALRRPASGAAIKALLSNHECEDSRWLTRRLGELRSAPASDRPEDVLEICAATWRALQLALLTREASGPLDVDGSFARLADVLAARAR